MRINTLCTGCMAAALTLTAACYAGTEDDGVEFRDWDDDDDGDAPEFWELGLNNPANGDTQVAADDDVSPFDLIWDVSGGTTSQSSGDPTSDIGANQVIRQTVADEILDGQGNLLCTAVQSQASGRRAYQLLDADGEVLLTLWHRYVFAGDVHIPKKGWKLGKLIKKNTLYSFRKNRIHEGTWWTSATVATADTKIASANPMRKLELAALVAGECGSAGI